MRRAALLPLLLLLLGACGTTSKDQFGLPTQRFLSDCQHGDLEITVGLSGAANGESDRNDPLQYLVQVANNSRKDVTVKVIRVEAKPSEIIRYRIDNSYRQFNQLIAENEEQTFELPTIGHGMQPGPEGQRYGQNALEVTTTVTLEGGDEYRCRFAIPIP